jgi:lauroyl/myristoyl acyltransferase
MYPIIIFQLEENTIQSEHHKQEKQKISTDFRQETTAFNAWIGREAESRINPYSLQHQRFSLQSIPSIYINKTCK